jgi:hypothetical protein
MNEEALAKEIADVILDCKKQIDVLRQSFNQMDLRIKVIEEKLKGE